MAAVTESAHRNHFADDPHVARTVSILNPPTIKMSAPPPGDPMDISSPTSSAPPSVLKSESIPTTNGTSSHPPVLGDPNGSGKSPGSIMMPAPSEAAPALHQQPKIVQAAFIHKLYTMLENKHIKHLISWSPSGESFVMQPSTEFSKMLMDYFKHANISSFVRQLNMYGFQKVSDVFHHGKDDSDSTLWEFKHGNGNFKRGDIASLREIKRRASRHALAHRDYGSNHNNHNSHSHNSSSNHTQKPLPLPLPPLSQPGTPVETMPPMQDGGDHRMNMEHVVYDLSARLRRSEESAHYMQIKQHAMLDSMTRLLHINRELSRVVLALAPPQSPDSAVHQDVAHLQGEIQRQLEVFRSFEEHHEPTTYAGARPYLAHMENGPVSPRQLPQDDPRRATLAVPQPRQSSFHPPPVPSNLSIRTRRPYGSIGGGTTQSSPSSLRAQAPLPPHAPHPLAHVEVPPSSLARRHTAADIRALGWQHHNAPPPPPYVSGPPSSQWPSSPSRLLPSSEDQRIRDSFSHYSMQKASKPHSRPASPPPTLAPFVNGNASVESFESWSWSKAMKAENKNLHVLDSAPPTRRGSMAHILNPTDTAEQDEEHEDPHYDEDRKRKRLY